MHESPRDVFVRLVNASELPRAEMAKLLGCSESMVYRVLSGRRPYAGRDHAVSLPLDWLPRLPPDIAVPVIEAVIVEKFAELNKLERMLQAKKKSRQGGLTGTRHVGEQSRRGFVNPFDHKPRAKASSVAR